MLLDCIDPKRRYLLSWRPIRERAFRVWARRYFHNLHHAFLQPKAVRSARISPPQMHLVDQVEAKPDWARYSSGEDMGDFTHANAELGEKLLEMTIEAVAREFSKIDRDSPGVGEEQKR